MEACGKRDMASQRLPASPLPGREQSAKAEIQGAPPYSAVSQDQRGLFFRSSQANVSLRQLLCQEDKAVGLQDAQLLGIFLVEWNPALKLIPIHPILWPNDFVQNIKSVTVLPLVVCHIVNVPENS